MSWTAHNSLTSASLWSSLSSMLQLASTPKKIEPLFFFFFFFFFWFVCFFCSFVCVCVCVLFLCFGVFLFVCFLGGGRGGREGPGRWEGRGKSLFFLGVFMFFSRERDGLGLCFC